MNGVSIETLFILTALMHNKIENVTKHSLLVPFQDYYSWMRYQGCQKMKPY